MNDQPDKSNQENDVLKAAKTLGKRGGEARAKKLTKKQMSEIARLGGKARWKKRKPKNKE